MSKPQTEIGLAAFGRKYKKAVKNRLMEHPLKELDKELEWHRVSREIVFYTKDGAIKKNISHIDIDAWMCAKGAMKGDAIIITGFVAARYGGNGQLLEPSDCDPILYDQLQADYQQWKDWKYVNSYGEKKRLEQWDEMRRFLVKSI